MSVERKKFKFCQRKNKSKLNKNNSSELIEPLYEIFIQLNSNKSNVPIESKKKNIEMKQFQDSGLIVQKNNDDTKYNLNNNNKIELNNNLKNKKYVKITKLNNYKKVHNLKINEPFKKNYSKDKICENTQELAGILSHSKSTKNNTAYTSLTLGKKEINHKNISANKFIKSKYNSYKNSNKIASFKNNENKSISKIEFSSITDKNDTNISDILNLNLSTKNVENCLKVEDLIEITQKRKNIISMGGKKNDITFGKCFIKNNLENKISANNLFTQNIKKENSEIDVLKCVKFSNRLKKQKNKIQINKKPKIIVDNKNNINKNFISNKIKSTNNEISKNKFNVYINNTFTGINDFNKNKKIISENVKNDSYNILNNYYNYNNFININNKKNNFNDYIIEKKEIEYIPNKNDLISLNREEHLEKKEIKLNIKELKKLAHKNGLLKNQNNNNYNYEIIEEDEELTTENNDEKQIENFQSDNIFEKEKINLDKNKDNDKINIVNNNEDGLNNEIENEDLSSIIHLNLSIKGDFSQNQISLNLNNISENLKKVQNNKEKNNETNGGYKNINDFGVNQINSVNEKNINKINNNEEESKVNEVIPELKIEKNKLFENEFNYPENININYNNSNKINDIERIRLNTKNNNYNIDNENAFTFFPNDNDRPKYKFNKEVFSSILKKHIQSYNKN